jgi:hypothetical protein
VKVIRRNDERMDEEPEVKPDHELDSPENMALLNRLEDWWTQARIAHSDSRLQKALDEDFYDGFQWTDEEIEELIDRQQAALVFNEIKRSIDWIIGSERRMKMDHKVYPRGDEDRVSAEMKTELMKYISDVNKDQFIRSLAFSDAVRVGEGWVEDGVTTDPFEEMLYSRHLSWRDVWDDHLSTAIDGSDGRYLFRSKRVDEDIALAYFPERADKIKAAAESHDLYIGIDDDELFYSNRSQDKNGLTSMSSLYHSYNNEAVNSRRRRVRLIECWYRMPVNSQWIERNSDFPTLEGMEYKPELHKELLDTHRISLYHGVRQKVYLCIFIDGAILFKMPSPYAHNRFPFTKMVAYRSKRDGMTYGVIRNQRDPQTDLNKRRSKAIHILSTNQIEAEAGAFIDKEEAREEAARPDGIIEYKRGFQIRRNTNIALANEHLLMEESDKVYIREVAGVTGENLGSQTNATSGIAITARQNEGATSTMELFDNLRLFDQLRGEKRLSLIEQYYDEPKTIRIIGPRGAAKYAEINKDKNTNITLAKADYVVDSSIYKQSMRAAMFEQTLDMASKLPPELGLQLLDLVFDMADIPNKDEWVTRIRKLNNQEDPDAELTPEQLQQKEMQDQEAADQAGIAKAMAQAQLAELEAKVTKLKVDTVARQVETLPIAMSAAQQAVISPMTAQVTDSIIELSKQEVI